MATPTYTAIASITLGSSASSVTFSSIPQDYRDLVLVAQGTSGAAGNFCLQFNNDTGSNYARVVMAGDGSSDFSFSESAQSNLAAAFWDTNPTIAIVNIMDYSATDKHTTTISRSSSASNNQGASATAGRWADTSAIVTVDVFPLNTSFQSGATFALYGIAS